MRLSSLGQHKISLAFEYWRQSDDGEELVARGRQDVVCMRRQAEQMTPTAVPPALRQALQPYAEA
jgi:enediyne biosynthesis thioesterase